MGGICSGEDKERDASFLKKRQQSMQSDFSDRNGSEYMNDMDPEIIDRYNPLKYDPIIHKKPDIFVPEGIFEYSSLLKHKDVYLMNNYYAILGKSYDTGKKVLQLLEPALNITKSKKGAIHKIGLRFPNTKGFVGIGITSQSLAEKNNYCLLNQVQNEINNQWHPENDDFGGYFLLCNKHFNTENIKLVRPNSQIESVVEFPKWLSHDVVCIEYNQEENIITFEKPDIQISYQLDFNLELLQGDKDDSIHFTVILDNSLDSVEIIGDPEINPNIVKIYPQKLKAILYYDTESKFQPFKDTIHNDIKFQSNDNQQFSFDIFCPINNDSQRFGYLEPAIKFPQQYPLRLRIAIFIQSVGNGPCFLGITRQAYARKNKNQLISQKNMLGKEFLVGSDGKSLINNKKIFDGFEPGQMVVLEYDAIQNQLVIYVQDYISQSYKEVSINQKVMFNEIYIDYTQENFQNPDQQYVFALGGMGDFKFTILSNYYDTKFELGE